MVNLFLSDFEAGEQRPRGSPAPKTWRWWMVLLLGVGGFFFILVSGFLMSRLSTQSFLGLDSGKRVAGNRWKFVEQNMEGSFSSSSTSEGGCVHSKQGKRVIVDDKGKLCSRRAIDKKTGCCKENTLPFPCSSCHPFFSSEQSTKILGKNRAGIEEFELFDSPNAGREEEEGEEGEGGELSENPLFFCCDEFEVCVSCCLESGEGEGPLLELGVTKFEECMAICRTSSCSIAHQKVYLFPKTKYCFGNVSHVPILHYQGHSQASHLPCRKLGS